MDNQELLNQVTQMLEEQTATIQKMLDEQTRKIDLKIENDVTKRIDALFDGYKLTHEKQWELEREVENIKRRLELLEAKAG